MKSELDLIKFTLTREMAKEMININSLKKELVNKKIEYEYLNDKGTSCAEIEKEIKILEDRINIAKKKFITLFQSSNKDQIQEYLNIIKK